MTADVYYNENDPFAVEWLKQLIVAGAIEPGDVDDRDIKDVKPHEIAHYTQCHFFAGIGVWSYSLRLAGWPRERPVWTGSCPCQPFSAAGKGVGFDDKRHLWPYWHWLISQLEPDTILGEQVASKDGLLWFDLVQADLEGSGYASGGLDLCAAGVGAPHIRQRLWFFAKRMADADTDRFSETRERFTTTKDDGSIRNSAVSGMADTIEPGLERFTRDGETSDEPGSIERTERLCDAGGVGDALNQSREWDAGSVSRTQTPLNGTRVAEHGGQYIRSEHASSSVAARPGPVNGFWQHSDWLGCRDGKFRPVEPGTFPLVDGASARVGRLRGYGNAINAEAAKAFIEAVMEI